MRLLLPLSVMAEIRSYKCTREILIIVDSFQDELEVCIETVEKVTNHKVTTTSVWSPRFSK